MKPSVIQAKPTRSAKVAELREFGAEPEHRPMMHELYRRATTQLRKQRKHQRSEAKVSKSETDPQRLLHELQVHQVELEMQNEELQKARDAMEAGLEKYSDLYDFAPVGYFTLTATGIINLVNLTGASLLGIERSWLVGQPFGLLVSVELRSVFQAFLKQVFASQTKQSIDLALLIKGQPPRTVTIEAQRLLNSEECRAAVMDITGRKQAEEKVRGSEIRYRRLFEAAQDGVLVLDPATRKITDANPFMTRLLGYPQAQLVGKELFEIGLLKDEAASRKMFEMLKRNHEVRYEDLPLESQGGRHQEVEVVANLYEVNGQPVIQCNIRDITERKAAADALGV
ncbi:MAG: PAS domain S-box protein, partial [Akkermansiaceae bacterium]|nr:PAS domain S-box protein [Verrucomicrobiales bacterium]